jgi:diguanylate cyclase (GGDEF)-like protein
MKRPGEQRLEDAIATLDSSLTNLYAAIKQRIREEQLTNQLTQLPNLDALEAWLSDQIDDSIGCWVALVELDGFKAINQAFGYENADLLLKEVARTLHELADHDVAAYHAHGDEFYLAGPLHHESTLPQVESRLDQARQAIAAIRKASDKGTMTCTVSIGWTTLEDALTREGGATAKYMVRRAEDANKVAKSAGRNCVRRWDKTQKLPPMVDPRVNCKGCGAVISLLVASAKWEWGGKDMTCPNCAKTIERPVVERREKEGKAPAKERRTATKPQSKSPTPTPKTTKKPATKKKAAKKPTKPQK